MQQHFRTTYRKSNSSDFFFSTTHETRSCKYEVTLIPVYVLKNGGALVLYMRKGVTTYVTTYQVVTNLPFDQKRSYTISKLY